MQANKELNKLRQIIKELHGLSKQLISILDDQTNAVVSVNEELIERNAEEYSDLKKAYQKQEQKFVKELTALFSTNDADVTDLRLTKLEKIFPGSLTVIKKWQDMLREKTLQLQEKHQKLNTLLEFALERNTELIRSIYRLHNQEYTQYHSGGDKSDISSGIAINKEV